MAQECGFFNAQLVGEEYDRVYLAEQFAAYFASFIGNGVFARSMQQLEVTSQDSPNMTIKVLPGQAWINGWWYRNTSNHTLPISVADGVLSRIDTLVLRWSNSERDMYLHIIEGTPSANPVAPGIMRGSDYYDLQLATISIPFGAIKITQAQITDTRSNSAVCGWVHALIEQLDTTDLFNQFTTFFNEFKANQLADYTSWTAAQKAVFLQWVGQQQAAYTQFVTDSQAAYEAYIAATQSDYDTWTTDKKAEYDAWVEAKEKAYDDWVTIQTGNYQSYITQQMQLYSDFVTQKQADYNQWVIDTQAAYDAYVVAQEQAYATFVSNMESDYDTWTAAKKAEWIQWVTDQETAFTTFVTTETTAYNTWISQQEQAFSLWYSTHTQQWEEDFNTWFDGIKGQLSGDIATSLQNQIDNLKAVQPTVQIAEIQHNKNKYVQAHLYETTYSAGVQGAGEGPAGGGALVSTPIEYTMDDRNNISFKAKPGFGTVVQVVKLSDDMYNVLFQQKVTSLVLVL